MGTRHLIGIILDGEVKVANYGQWDGYPSGQGVDVLKFLAKGITDDFREKVRGCSFISEEDLTAAWVSCGMPPGSEWVGLDVSEKFGKNFPHLSRDCGSDILDHIANSESGLQTRDSIAFAGDGLFCEWAYFVNLDDNTLEVYKGFSKEPVPEGQRFAYLNETVDTSGNSVYYPITLVKTYSLTKLPKSDKFISDLENNED